MPMDDVLFHRSHAMELPPGWVAQPELGGEHEGTKWELNRVYDPSGRLNHDRTFWEVRQLFADDPDPRFVEYAAAARAGVAFGDFMRLTTPLAEVERWLARTSSTQRSDRATRRAHKAAAVRRRPLVPA